MSAQALWLNLGDSHFMPYKIIKKKAYTPNGHSVTTERVQLRPSTRLEDPNADIGIVFRYGGAGFFVTLEDTPKLWGHAEFRDWRGQQYDGVILRPRALNYTNPSDGWYFKGQRTSWGVTKPPYSGCFARRRAANRFPLRLENAHKKCYKCGERAHWMTYAYLGGSTAARQYSLCMDCTNKGMGISKLRLDGRMNCRICHEHSPDVRLIEEEGQTHFKSPRYYRVFIHAKCREKIHKIEATYHPRWRDLPSNLKIEI